MDLAKDIVKTVLSFFTIFINFFKQLFHIKDEIESKIDSI